MSAHYPDQRDWKRELLLHGHPAYLNQWDWVRRWLAELRLAVLPQDYFELHRALLQSTYDCQSFYDQSRERSQSLRDDIKQVKASGLGADAVRPLSEQIELARRDREAAAAILGILRMLGDALVWRVLRYERPIITVLGQGRAVGRLAEGPGFDAELAKIAYLWEERGVFALHTDLTNCIRHADILSIESWDPFEVRLTESKASGQPPTRIQAERLERVTRLVNEGFHPRGADGGALYFQRPRIRYETSFDRLRELIAAARTATHAYAEIEPGVLVEAWDEANPGGLSSAERADRHTATRAEHSWDDDSDVIVYSASARRLRDRHADHTFSSLVPMALLPLALDDAVDLVFGRLDFITTINASALERQLASRGVRAAVARGRDGAAETFMHAERGTASIEVPATVREQVQLELLQLRVLFATVDWFLREVEQQGSGHPNVAIRYEDERAVWEGYPEVVSTA